MQLDKRTWTGRVVMHVMNDKMTALRQHSMARSSDTDPMRSRQTLMAWLPCIRWPLLSDQLVHAANHGVCSPSPGSGLVHC
jgi:hypothetical protein